MTTALIIAASVAMAGVFIWLVFFRTKASVDQGIKKALVELGFEVRDLKFDYEYTTPKGVRVRSVVHIPDTAFNDIDVGIENQLTRHNAKYPQWQNYKLHSDYDVLVIEPTSVAVINTPGAPTIDVKGIQAAGTCIGVHFRRQWPDKPYIVVPHQQKQEWRFRTYLVNSIWAESEHVRLYKNDTVLFSFFRGERDVHPLIPGSAAVPLVGNAVPQFSCAMVDNGVEEK